MTMNTDGYPAPEARVREFLEALAQENTRGAADGLAREDELAWAVPDEGELRTLTATDLRDVLNELAAYRGALDTIDAVLRADASIRAMLKGSGR